MKQNKYKNILIIETGILVLFLVYHNNLFLYSALCVGVLSGLFPRMANLINLIWIKLALLLGWINSRILLSIVYFLFLIPLAFISKIFISDPLKLKKQSKSLFSTRNHVYNKNDLENTW